MTLFSGRKALVLATAAAKTVRLDGQLIRSESTCRGENSQDSPINRRSAQCRDLVIEVVVAVRCEVWHQASIDAGRDTVFR
jgi:hypothetical protein